MFIVEEIKILTRQNIFFFNSALRFTEAKTIKWQASRAHLSKHCNFSGC